MDISFFKPLCFLLLSLFAQQAMAQQVPVGQWQSHFSFQSAGSVEIVGDKVYAARSGLYAYSVSDNDFTHYTKVNGLSDVNIQFIRYDASTANLLIVYQNGNIDLLNEGQVSNMPDIRNLNITGSKKINSVYFKNKLMYLCTDFGIVVLNPVRKEIKESYVLQDASEIIKVKGLTSFQGKFYAATTNGLFVADENNPVLQNYANWVKTSSLALQHVFTHQGSLYATSDTLVYSIAGTVLTPTYQSRAPITKVRSGALDIYLCIQSEDVRMIAMLNAAGTAIDSVGNINPNDVAEYNPNQIWEADEWEGLIRLSNRKDKQAVNPNGPYTATGFKLTAAGNDLYVCAGGHSGWIASLNSGGISRYRNGEWNWYNRFVGTPGMDSVIDIMDLAVDKRNQYIYAASYGGGLLEIHPDNTTTTYKENGFIQSQIGNPGANIIAGLAFDAKNNLWMSNYSAPQQLVVKKADGSWQHFAFPYSTGEKSAAQLVIDDAGQKWLVAPRGIGIFVLNDNNTIDNKNDDANRLLTTGSGNGNLPNNNVLSIAKDRNGKIWVGTNDGIGIFNCPESVLETGGCDAELKIVKYDLNAGLLFQRESVNSIAVDGANNKWIGTNNGVWLISDDAEKIIHRFTKDNSPLPSDEVNSIAILPESGEVFIATNAGMVSYRSEATEGHSDNSDLLVFPNPVPSGYSGMIAVKGLVENSDVRITDVAGQLVYRTKAQGGQAVWNGRNYLGDRPRTGVYYVFVTNTDGTQTGVGKFVFNE